MSLVSDRFRLRWLDSLEKGMTTHSSILAWRIPGTEERGVTKGWIRLKWLSTHAPTHGFTLSSSRGPSSGWKWAPALGGRQDKDQWAAQLPMRAGGTFDLSSCFCPLLKEFEAMGEQAGDRGGSHPGTLTLACTKGLSRLSSPHPSLRRHGMQEA